MCFVLAWKTGLWASAREPWLSPFSETVGSPLPRSRFLRSLSMACTHKFLLETLISACYWSASNTPSFVKRSRRHVASLAARVSAIYSASVEDRATVACFLEHQLIGPPFSIKIKPDVDFRLSLSPAQSESEYPSIFSSSLPPYVMPQCFDPLRYLRIVLTASVCWWLGFLAKRLTNDIAKAMSGLVSTMENIIDPVIP